MTTRILTGDALEQLRGLPDESVHMVCTSPPYYGLRCYDTEGQIGLESTPEDHIARLVEVFREVRRVLRKDGCVFMNYGDAYASTGEKRDGGHDYVDGGKAKLAAAKGMKMSGVVKWNAKPKDLLMMPSRVALALQADGWYLRSMMPWLKRSAMPESVTDRPATAIEYVFLLTRSPRYFFDMEAVRQTATIGRTVGLDFAKSRGSSATNPKNAGQVCWRPEDGADPGSGRNYRNSDLFYASLEPPYGLISSEDGPLALDVNPAGYSESHFATFPPKLIEPLIKAGTSEKGCCPECGAPWVRQVEREFQAQTDVSAERGIREQHQHDASAGWPGSPRGATNGKTLGWSPSCECHIMRGPISETAGTPRDPVPCVVLDPFLGAGTTALVADRLGRDSIGIELNPEYAEMARKRITGDAPLFAEVT